MDGQFVHHWIGIRLLKLLDGMLSKKRLSIDLMVKQRQAPSMRLEYQRGTFWIAVKGFLEDLL
jgi:hypothetical protein